MTTGILVIGHGSRETAPQEMMQNLIELMRAASTDAIITYCFMAISRPTIQEGLTFMAQEPIDILICVPLFFSSGTHVSETIPHILKLRDGEKKGTFTRADNVTIPLVYAEPVGADPLLAKILLKHAGLSPSSF